MYLVNADYARKRMWTEGPVPIPHLKALTALASKVCGAPVKSIVLLTDVGKKLQASMAMCPKSEVSAWRKDLGLPDPPP